MTIAQNKILNNIEELTIKGNLILLRNYYKKLKLIAVEINKVRLDYKINQARQSQINKLTKQQKNQYNVSTNIQINNQINNQTSINQYFLPKEKQSNRNEIIEKYLSSRLGLKANMNNKNTKINSTNKKQYKDEEYNKSYKFHSSQTMQTTPQLLKDKYENNISSRNYLDYLVESESSNGDINTNNLNNTNINIANHTNNTNINIANHTNNLNHTNNGNIQSARLSNFNSI